MDARHVSSKLRRIDTTERLTDKLGERAEAVLDAPKLNVAEAQLLLRESREYMRLEREHYGEAQSPSAAVHISIEHDGVDKRAMVDRSFRTWVTDNLRLLDVDRVNSAPDDVHALVEVGLQLLQKTSFLDDVTEEERQRDAK